MARDPIRVDEVEARDRVPCLAEKGGQLTMVIHHCDRNQVRQLVDIFAYPEVRNGRVLWRIPRWLRAMYRSAKKPPVDIILEG